MKSAELYSLIKWVIAGGIAVLMFILIRQCNTQGWFKPSPPDTVRIVRDTIPFPVVHDSLVYVPVPYEVIKYKPFQISTTDSFISYEPFNIDTIAMLDDYLSARLYMDTVFNSQYGFVIVSDTISRNKIIARGINRNITIPLVTNTVTLTQPKRIIAYYGLEAFGFPIGGGASLGVKMRNDNYFGLKTVIYKGNKILYGGEVKFPIRLRK